MLESELFIDKEILRCSNNDLKANFNTEREYLLNLEKPDPIIEMKKDYIRSLHQLVRYKCVYKITYMFDSPYTLLNKSGKMFAMPPLVSVDN